MNELVPAILAAVNENRLDDFIVLSETLVEECDDNPIKAIAELAIAANFLHRHPSIPLGLVAVMNQDDLDEGSILEGDVMLEVLDIIEGLDDAGQPSAAGQEILARFDLRPGSSTVMGNIIRIFSILLSTMQMQILLNRHSPDEVDTDEALRRAIDQTRKVVQDGMPPRD